jgi:hypothetical protein
MIFKNSFIYHCTDVRKDSFPLSISSAVTLKYMIKSHAGDVRTTDQKRERRRRRRRGGRKRKRGLEKARQEMIRQRKIS